MEAAPQQASAFPAPPYYFQRYTAANLALAEKFRASKAATTTARGDTDMERTSSILSPPPPPITIATESSSIHSSELDPEINKQLEALDFPIVALDPPPLPTKGFYWQFGKPWPIHDTMTTLEEQGVEQLYPKGQIDCVKELKKLNHSALFNFLELVNTLATNPSEYHVKVDQIRLIFINMHHILNEYRPHQAKETLRLMIQDQLDRKRKDTAALRSTCADLRRQLAGLRALKDEQATLLKTEDHIMTGVATPGNNDLVDLKPDTMDI